MTDRVNLFDPVFYPRFRLMTKGLMSNRGPFDDDLVKDGIENLLKPWDSQYQSKINHRDVARNQQSSVSHRECLSIPQPGHRRT